MNILLTYIVIQLLSTAYGLSVIETVKPIVNKKLIDDGYVLKNKNSMYKYNEGLVNFFKGLIPFYYAIKAIKLIKGSDAIEKEAIRQISKGNYVTFEEYENDKKDLDVISIEDKSLVKVNNDPVVSFEKPEKYIARRNDFDLLETNEEEVVYEESYETREEKLSITPFKSGEIRTIEREVTKADIVSAITHLSPEELDTLGNKMHELAAVKKGRIVLSLKDVA